MAYRMNAHGLLYLAILEARKEIPNKEIIEYVKGILGES